MEFFLKFFWDFSGGFFCRNFRRNFLGGIFLEKFFGRIFLGGFFGRIYLGGFLGGFFWEEFFAYIGIDLFVKILVFVKIMSESARKF